MLPSLSVALLPRAIFVAQFAQATGENFSPSSEIGEAFEKMAHETAPILICPAGAPAGIGSPITGRRRTSVV